MHMHLPRENLHDTLILQVIPRHVVPITTYRLSRHGALCDLPRDRSFAAGQFCSILERECESNVT
jgi:hypothetical protein